MAHKEIEMGLKRGQELRVMEVSALLCSMTAVSVSFENLQAVMLSLDRAWQPRARSIIELSDTLDPDRLIDVNLGHCLAMKEIDSSVILSQSDIFSEVRFLHLFAILKTESEVSLYN